MTKNSQPESKMTLQRRQRTSLTFTMGHIQKRMLFKSIFCFFCAFNCLLLLQYSIEHYFEDSQVHPMSESNSSDKVMSSVPLEKGNLNFGLGLFPRRQREKIDDRYSALSLDSLKNYHLDVVNEEILARVPAQIPFLIQESNTCRKFAGNSIVNRRFHNKSSQTGDAVNHRQEVVAVAVVSSALRNFRERQNVRSSWGDRRIAHLTGIPVVFVVGTTTSARGQQSLVRESLAFRDIVQADFLDTYNNLSVKSLAGLSWATQHCPSAPWVLKTDDDMSVNVFALSEFLQTRKETGHRISPSLLLSPVDGRTPPQTGTACKQGRCLLCDKVSEHAVVLDSRAYKFGVSATEWQEKTYPPYCHGVGYLVPNREVPALLAAAQATNYVRVEDVFVTGILARAAGLGIQRMRSPDVWYDAFHMRDRVSYFLDGKRLTLELDRDLEGGRWSGPAVWHALLRRHNVSLE